jgi:hypothetical protein
VNVRRASSTTTRSGVSTSRTDTRSPSRSSSFIATTPRASTPISPSASSPGSATSTTARANGRATSSRRRWWGKTRASHQRATSGQLRRRSVSPVGAQSTTITSQRPDASASPSAMRATSSSSPGGTASSCAAIRSTPRSVRTPASHVRIAPQRRSSSSWAETCWAHSPPPSSPGSGPTCTCSTSATECAGSVETSSVRWPAAAHRRAVAAATEVLPTPPLPV